MELPPLPPEVCVFKDSSRGIEIWGQTSAQMRAYGEACAAAERERVRLAFWSVFHKSGETFFDYLHGEQESEASTQDHWNQILDVLEPLAVPRYPRYDDY